MTELIRTGLRSMGIPEPPGAAEALARYGALLLAQNQVMNLTAITEPREVATLHFLDSAALLKAAAFSGRKVIDVGTGAGFPGLVLKLLEPSLSLTLLDGTGKRVDWLKRVCAELELTGVEFLHARAEEQALLPGYREQFDLAVSRAVAPLRLLSELCLPFVRPGGCFLSMKSTESGGELSEALSALHALGGRVLPAFDYTIPHTAVTHRVILVEKLAATPKGYPRRWSRMQKDPL